MFAVKYRLAPGIWVFVKTAELPVSILPDRAESLNFVRVIRCVVSAKVPVLSRFCRFTEQLVDSDHGDCNRSHFRRWSRGLRCSVFFVPCRQRSVVVHSGSG